MGYAALAIALLGFAVGTMFRLQMLLAVIVLLLMFSILFAFGSGLSFFDGILTILAVQTVVQGSYLIGLIARAALTFHDPRHIL
jgi:hypothetical protein